MKLFIRRFGQGFPVIILHGLLGLSDNWVSFGRRLAADFDVIIPDLRNHGQSPHSALFDYQSLVSDLEEMAGELGLTRFSLVGHSLGGKIAMQYAMEHQETLDKLVIVDISPREYTENTEQSELIDAMLQVDFSGLRSRTGIEQQLSRTVKSTRLRQFLMKNAYWRDKDHLAWRINLASIRENLPLIFREIPSGRQYIKPALFVRGGLSMYVTGEDEEDICRRFPNAVIKTIEKATHWVHADAPEEFYSLVREFLDSGEIR